MLESTDTAASSSGREPGKNHKLTFGAMVNYGLGAAGIGILKTWYQTWFTIFATDVAGIGAGIVSALIFFGRIFDAVNDPIIGGMADSSEPDKKGNCYPKWIRGAGIGFAIVMVVMFMTRSMWPVWAKVLCLAVTYLIGTIMSTGTEMAHVAVMGRLSENGSERARCSGIRMIFDVLGCQSVVIFASILIGVFSIHGKTENGYLISMILYGIIAAVMIVWSANHIREVVRVPKQAKPSVKLQLTSLVRNRYALCIVGAMLMIGIASYAIVTMLTYFFTYWAGDIKLLSIWSILTVIANFLGAAMGPAMVRVCKGHKGRAVSLSALAAAGLFSLKFFAGVSPLFFACALLAHTCLSSAFSIVYSVVGDAADYGEYLTGHRGDSFTFAAASFMSKVGGAAAPAIILALMDKAGYVANQPQNETVLGLMHAGVSFLPAGAMLLLAVIFLFYNMTDKQHDAIIAELHERRTKGSGAEG